MRNPLAPCAAGGRGIRSGPERSRRRGRRRTSRYSRARRKFVFFASRSGGPGGQGGGEERRLHHHRKKETRAAVRPRPRPPSRPVLPWRLPRGSRHTRIYTRTTSKRRSSEGRRGFPARREGPGERHRRRRSTAPKREQPLKAVVVRFNVARTPRDPSISSSGAKKKGHV